MPVVLLMGPTASGKTDLAVGLAERFRCDLISVDSALVYRGMDIGTAKPDAETLARAPHRLIDIRDPEETYSAGEFVRDAHAAIEASIARERVPLLVGGTMLYFRALTRGIAELPAADDAVRATIDREAEERGWPAMHAALADIDPKTASRLNPNDRQRIQRALEVYRLSGKPLSEWHAEAEPPESKYRFAKIGLRIEPRSLLHERIERRLDDMVKAGFEHEVRRLMRRPQLTVDHSSMRSVGYRQYWQHLEERYDGNEARNRTLFATRQLAKRQLTWLRAEKDVFLVDPLEADAIGTISSYLLEFFDA